MRNRLERLWFGEDFFISYSRSDAIAYAAALANRLGVFGFSCFLDQWQPIAGRDIPPAIRRSLRRASSLVVIASRGAATSDAVAAEIGEFRTRNRPMVPIGFESTLPVSEAFSSLAGIAWSADSLEALRAGVPADEVVSRLSNTFQYRQRNQRVRWSLLTFALVSVALAGVSGLLVGRARSTLQRLNASTDSLRVQRRVAQENLARYTEAAAEAKRQAEAAEERRRIATSATLARDSARALRDAARRELSASIDLVENRTVLLEFDRSNVGPNAQRVLRGLLALVRDTHYPGEVRLTAHVAPFCVTVDAEGSPLGLAPANLPISQCAFWPASDEYALALSQRFGRSIAAMATAVGIDGSRLSVVPTGRDNPRVPYPPSGTASEWNTAAHQNNRVQMTLVGAGPGGPR